MLQTGTAWLKGQLFSHASTEVTYSRGADSATINVVRAETTAELMNSFGLNVDTRIADFLIKEEDLVLVGTTRTQPERGDRITFVLDDQTMIYEVLPELPEGTHRESDRYGNVYRVHTKLVSDEYVP